MSLSFDSNGFVLILLLLPIVDSRIPPTAANFCILLRPRVFLQTQQVLLALSLSTFGIMSVHLGGLELYQLHTALSMNPLNQSILSHFTETHDIMISVIEQRERKDLSFTVKVGAETLQNYSAF